MTKVKKFGCRRPWEGSVFESLDSFLNTRLNTRNAAPAAIAVISISLINTLYYVLLKFWTERSPLEPQYHCETVVKGPLYYWRNQKITNSLTRLIKLSQIKRALQAYQWHTTLNNIKCDVVFTLWTFYYRMSFRALGADQLQSQLIMRWWICVVLLAEN